MKIVVTGGSGQFGQCLKVQADRQLAAWIFLERRSLDIANANDWEAVLAHEQPDWVINAAAYTNVEAAEDHRDEAFRINAEGVALGAKLCAEAGVNFIHLSTDYVFDGAAKTPYDEAAPTHPLSVYGASKLAGERAVRAAHPEAIIVRLSWLYSPYGKNFLRTMLQRFADGMPTRVVNDQVASPTCGLSFADDLQELIRAANKNKKLLGSTLHYAQGGEASWYDFARAIADLSNRTVELSAVDSAAFPTKAVRPAYSKLDTTRFCKAIGRDIADWKSDLQRCINAML
ncbi:MAG: dTDP-4-dehydrorhamnose reductase [Flavobacteriales bacterium]